ncbi:nucleolar protein 8 [Gracilinanus agilis]|uniref:nucleolar protein 8 n=1 Tax=Gracilinanus agilis TaxID=191870 RepID=UPI001CFCB722|nr:nucleolar protein 8 [Gracilinanus agilis]
MAASVGERRLFVGGLGPTVTQDDVRAQLGRFGAVSSVELVSRVDVLGNPEKTFAYVNVALSEAALQKCLSALNKTAWKGGTLQVQLAKESFLHRLAKERLQAKAKQEQQFSGDPTAGSETSLGKNGILEFHMKAVPGTEVPGHKDWVVSKFGRVLPVLHLRSQNKRKILKYDPSKYCHNLKKFEQDVTNTVSISDLTWKLEGGDDTMSKKRQGQFPAFRNCPPKRAKVGGSHCSPAPPSVTQQPGVQKTNLGPVKLPTSASSRHKNSQKPETVFLPTSKSPFVRRRNTMSDDDLDSEDELKALIAEEKKSQKTAFFETDSTEGNSFEVVSSDFKPSLASSGVKQASCSNSTSHPAESDKEYDSGDTDEIIAGGKNSDQNKGKAKMSPKRKAKAKKDCLQNRTDRLSSGQNTEIRKRKHSSGNEKESSVTRPTKNCAPPESEEESEENLDYDSMMANCYRLDLTLADLERLASEGLQSAGDSDDCAKQDLPGRKVPDSGQKRRKAPNRRAQCINPSDILASLLEGEEISDQKPPQENMWKSKFQAFKGVGALYEGETPSKAFKSTGVFAHKKGHHSWNQEASTSPKGKQAFGSNTCSSEEMTPPRGGREANEADGPGKAPRKRQASRDQCTTEQSSTSGSECENGLASSLSSSGTKTPLGVSAKTHRTDLGSDAGMGKPKQGKSDSFPLRPSPGQEPKLVVLKTDAKKPIQVSVEKVSAFSCRQGKAPSGSQEETDCPPPRIPSSDALSPPKNSQDNQKRLAALEERKRERELQKQLVHSALSSVDSSLASKPTHIVFGSDSEEETEEKGGNEQPLPENRVKQDLTGKTSGKLFESSEDDEEESDDDEARFQIKPQFEGKAGKKLMNLQSHFGADDRFRMDARFLESESEEEEEAEEIKKAETAEEEELVAEKKKNLDVIKNLLRTGHPAPKPSQEEMAAKQFRNIVRYDPTRLDHATFERKTDPEEKESKARRRKKREEAEKLPEVSKDLYHSIAADLKDRFRATEPAPGGTGATGPWNETPEEMEMTEAPSAGPSEFTFSFFGSDSSGPKEEPYKIEARAPGRMAWQQDPRFQDSSSEEDDEEEEVEPDNGSREAAGAGEVPLPEKPASRFFFFLENDERLGVGPASFWQGSGSRASSEDWESRTVLLLQDCRKKHKAAKRKAKP